MNIKHRPLFDTQKIEEHYTEKDGVPVKYVCTSSTNLGTVAYDIFYRELPHPEFGNRYFGIFMRNGNQIMITNGDSIEDVDFDMVKVNDEWHYSQHRWDCHSVSDDLSIDGGRAYLKMTGAFADKETGKFRVKDGEFMERRNE